MNHPCINTSPIIKMDAVYLCPHSCFHTGLQRPGANQSRNKSISAISAHTRATFSFHFLSRGRVHPQFSPCSLPTHHHHHHLSPPSHGRQRLNCSIAYWTTCGYTLCITQLLIHFMLNMLLMSSRKVQKLKPIAFLAETHITHHLSGQV